MSSTKLQPAVIQRPNHPLYILRPWSEGMLIVGEVVFLMCACFPHLISHKESSSAYERHFQSSHGFNLEGSLRSFMFIKCSHSKFGNGIQFSGIDEEVGFRGGLEIQTPSHNYKRDDLETCDYVYERQ
jgi:hypothetical protein